MRHRCAAFRVLLWGGASVTPVALPATLISLTGTMDSAYRGQPAVYAYSGTRTNLYATDTAYRGAPMVVAVNG